jgi:predicted NAD/FAD-binding protein
MSLLGELHGGSVYGWCTIVRNLPPMLDTRANTGSGLRIAVVGSGVAGLGAAYLLSRAHHVELFERDTRPGGHVHTVEHRGLCLDTGFIVHNLPNYPFLIRLFRELGISTQESEMSFSVACCECGLEWSGRRPFAQSRNVVSPRFHRFLFEVARWLRTAASTLDTAEGLSLGQYAERHGYSERFRTHFLLPLTSALWSTAPERALDVPADFAIRFFENHGMLGFGRFRWRTVSGGSRRYVDALLARLQGTAHVGLGVRAIRRFPDGLELTTDDGGTHRFDRAVVATHADQALALLADPTPEERSALGAFRYTANETVLHTDERFLPRTRAARASWNYEVNGALEPTVTYYLNRLQRLEADEHYCVTLNRTAEIDPERVIMRTVYDHPLYTADTLRGQRELAALDGAGHTVYAGAHLGNGFHEDGLASAVRAAASLGVNW